MQRIQVDHHTLVQSYLLAMFRSWEKRNYNTKLDIKSTNPLHTRHAGMKDETNSLHVK